MKYSLAPIALVLICMMNAPLAGFAQKEVRQDRGYIVQIGDEVPSFELEDIQGNTFTRESLLGTTYILQFTASWCGVCRKEMPHLEREVWLPFREHDFVLLGVDLDEPKGKVAQFATQMEITYPIAPDPDGSLFYAIAAPKSGVTRNVVVNEYGEIVFLTRLFDEDEFSEMINVVETLVSE
jgi:peroxiredoxin